MIAVDTSILVYAHRVDSEWHEPALESLTELANSGSPWAIPWPCLHEFIAITTHPNIYLPPSPMEVALASIDAWSKSPGFRFLGEGPGYFEKLSKLAIAGKVKGPKIHDGRIAAICLNHGVNRLWKADRDFSSFPALKCHNPLV